MKFLAFDPSISCTGWALLEAHNDTLDGEFRAGGYIIPDSREAPLVERILDLAKAIGERARVTEADCIIIETPAATGRNKAAQSFKGTAITIPVYGAAVGACIVAAAGGHRGIKMRGVPSDEWTKHRVPSTRSDADKSARVEYVRDLYKVGDLGPKSYAGNVADAVLIARWAIWKDRGLI